MKEIFLEFIMVCFDLKFTTEKANQKTDFLDITIQKRMKQDWNFPVYWKLSQLTASYHAVHDI